jgi:putative acetyltransferase
MLLREFRSGDELLLRDVFHSAVHELAIANYTREQVEAWSPEDFDREIWLERMQAFRPFVVEDAGRPIAYADLQPSGMIEHFFVSGPYARRGVGTLLMNRIHERAAELGLTELESHVSLTAQPFFRKFGFEIVKQQLPVRRGVALSNAVMKKRLGSA